MFEFTRPMAHDKTEIYELLESQVAAVLEGESNPIANAANLSSILFNGLTEVSWVGLYFLLGEELVVGPFQGLPACVRIPLGRGVCGTAAQKRCTLLVNDVNSFDGHIACDASSRSEIVIPLLARDEVLLGVLDLDSRMPARFDEEDRKGLERIAARWVGSLSGLPSFGLSAQPGIPT